jgi:acyl-CoA synthetase (AMP-forming)/AMP-acid ligase II
VLRTDLIAPIPELLRRHAAARGDKCAYRDAYASVTYAALLERTGKLAGHLVDNGIALNDTVAIFLPNSVAWIESCFAIARAGAVSVPISYDSTETEIAYRLNDANCKAVITTAERGDLFARLKASAPNLKTLIVTDRGACDVPALRYADLVTSPPKSAPRDPTSLHDTAFILYTSGTTGRAKGVQLTVHGMLWVNAACWVPITGLSDRDTVLSPLPLFHSYALNFSVLSVLATGASEYIMEKFSTAEALRLLKSGEFTYFPGVPTMFHYLLQATRGEKNLQFGNLRLCVSAGAIMPATLNREFEEHLGIQLLDGYGITETSTMVTMNWPTGGRVLGLWGVYPWLVRHSGAWSRGAHCRPERPRHRTEPGRRGDRSRPQRHARLSQQAGRNPQRAPRRLVSHRRSRQERRQRLSEHHRAAQGIDHSRRPEYRARGDRRGGECVRGGARLRRCGDCA